MTDALKIELLQLEMLMELSPYTLHLMFKAKLEMYKKLLGSDNIHIFYIKYPHPKWAWIIKGSTLTQLQEQEQLFYKIANEAKEEMENGH